MSSNSKTRERIALIRFGSYQHVQAFRSLCTQHRGNVAAVARELGCSRQSLHTLLNARPDLGQHMRDMRAKASTKPRVTVLDQAPAPADLNLPFK